VGQGEEVCKHFENRRFFFDGTLNHGKILVDCLDGLYDRPGSISRLYDTDDD
jgi:hypothetical protein